MDNFHNVKGIYEISSSLNKKQVVIYCCSFSAASLYFELNRAGIEIIGFIDSYEQEFDKFCGKPVLTIEELQEFDNNGVVTVISTFNFKYQLEIIDRLKKYSIKNIYVQGSVYDNNFGLYFFESEQMKEVIQKDKEKINYVYDHLNDLLSKQTFLNLLSYRLTNDYKFLETSNINNHPQYFPGKDIMEFTDKEVFVDAGTFMGDTILQFIKTVGGQDSFNKIYSFEPDKNLFTIAESVINLQKRRDAIKLFPYALFDKKDKVSFCEGFVGNSSIQEDGTVTVDAVALDELLSDREDKITYIKMDIEGAEMKALDGAKNIIFKDCPKLAICIYHNPQELWEIPYKILKEFPGYKIFIRHYSCNMTETVCYAIYEGER